MSKYYKAEDIIAFLNLHCPKDMWEYQIADLPTIEVSEDCISKAYLEQEIENHLLSIENLRTEKDEWWNKAFEVMVKIIENAPPVIPVEKAKEGEWINKQEKYRMAECSNCKKVTMQEMWGDKLVYYDYCPNCGAEMKGAEDE